MATTEIDRDAAAKLSNKPSNKSSNNYTKTPST